MKRFLIKMSRLPIRILFKTGLLRLFVRQLLNERDLLEKLIQLVTNRSDLVRIVQRQSEKKFFHVDESIIEEVLEGDKLSVVDVGAAGNIEAGLERYRHLLKVIAVEPRHDESLLVNREDFVLVPKLIGREEGRAVVNITRKPLVSSILEPTGSFLHYFAAEKGRKRFDVMKQVEYPMTTIAALLKETDRQIHYLKLDTQGTELDILNGLGEYRPIIIKTEISFLPLYKDQTIFFHLAEYLYDMGYILFHLRYASRSSPSPKKASINGQFTGNLIPMHGDAWFMPDWTRERGTEIFIKREKEYMALMLMFGMGDIGKFALEEHKASNCYGDRKDR